MRAKSKLKGALSGLRQFWAIENPLKIMKNAFISPQKLFSFSRYLSFCLDQKRLDQKDKVNFKFYDVTAWLTNSCNTQIAQYFEK